MTTRYHWTTAESAIVREHYAAGGPDACLPLLDRTRSAIHQHARGLGLKAPKHWRGIVPYTSSEFIDAQIRRVYQNAPSRGDVTALAKRIDRPRHWVSRRAVALGLVLPRFKDLPWSDTELDILAETTHLRPEQTARRLKRAGYTRSVTAVVVKRKRQGMRQERDSYSARELAGLMGVDGKTVARWISLGLLQATKAGTKRTEIQGGDEWRISPKQVRAFVIENLNTVDLRKIEPAKHWFVDLLANTQANRHAA